LLVMFVQIVLKRLAWRADIDDPPDNVISLHIEDDPEQIQSFIFWLEETLPHARISRMDRKKGKLVLVLLLGERDYKAAPSLLIERPEVESLSL
ncbi:MAG: hypothetical protein Q4C13_09245, partial [Clostridia bacterium]|nr:hypothetical protein [Clostridia bacterium]